MRRRVAGLVALACVITACSSTVDGTGRLGQQIPGPSGTPSVTGFAPTNDPTAPHTVAPPSGSGTAEPPTGPSGSSASAPPTTTCPHITYPYAHLKFDCAVAGLETGTTPDPVWPVNLSKSVEATWAMSEGAGHWGTTDGQSLEAIATNVRTQMLQEDPPAYGTSPTVQTTSSKSATVAGVDAWVLQTTFTLNPTFRKNRSLKVKVEKSWIVAMKVGNDDVSLWYVTIPDDVSSFWGQVHALTDTIKII
jgi:hypothetical protein